MLFGVISVRKLLLLLLLFAQVAYAKELDVVVSPLELWVTNCGQNGGEYSAYVTASVHNPTGELMYVNYSYFDFPTGAWKDAGRACSVGLSDTGVCRLNVKIALGGQGNGTVVQELVRMEGRLEQSGEVYTKSFLFTVHHGQSDRETSLLREMNATALRADAMGARLSQTCSGQDCCGLSPERAALNSSLSNIENATRDLPACRVQEAYLSVQAANLQLTSANSTNLAACGEALALLPGAAAASPQALANITAAEACFANTVNARAKWAQANESLAAARQAIAGDDYAAALDALNRTLGRSEEAVSAIGRCGFEGEPTATPISPNATAEPQIAVGGSSNYSGPAPSGEGKGGACPLMLPLALAFGLAFLRRQML